MPAGGRSKKTMGLWESNSCLLGWPEKRPWQGGNRTHQQHCGEAQVLLHEVQHGCARCPVGLVDVAEVALLLIIHCTGKRGML